MPNTRILREKQNITEIQKGTTVQPKIFKRTNVARHGSERLRLKQHKRKYGEVEPQAPTFHSGIKKNTKVTMQSNTHEMPDFKADKPNIRRVVNASCGNTDAGPIVTFTGPREAYNMKPDDLKILDVVLQKTEKIPIPKSATETQEANRPIPNSLAILNAAIQMIENDNIQEEKKSVQKTENTLPVNNTVRVNAAIPDAIKILNAAITKPGHYLCSRNAELTASDQFYGTQSEYHQDIMNYMKSLEIKASKPKPGYMTKQPEVTGAMRSKLVDWLAHVFQGTNEKIFHMTVHYIDTFLSRMSVVKSKLQLLACAAGMVACKTEEVYIQNAEYWVILGGETFTKAQLLKMERIILSVLKFELSRPTIVCFIRHVCYMGQINPKIAMLANYISELVLVEGDVYLRYAPSLLASAIITLATHTLGQSDIWPQKLEAMTDHTLKQMLPLISLLRKTFNNASKNPNSFVYKKYLTKRQHEVVKMKLKKFNHKEMH